MHFRNIGQRQSLHWGGGRSPNIVSNTAARPNWTASANKIFLDAASRMRRVRLQIRLAVKSIDRPLVNASPTATKRHANVRIGVAEMQELRSRRGYHQNQCENPQCR